MSATLAGHRYHADTVRAVGLGSGSSHDDVEQALSASMGKAPGIVVVQSGDWTACMEGEQPDETTAVFNQRHARRLLPP